MYNPNRITNSSSGSDTAVQKALSATPTPEYELNERFLLPYLDAKDEELEETLTRLEDELIAESQKEGNENNPVIGFLHALYSQELYLIMKNEQALHAAANCPPGKSLDTLSDEELQVLNDKYPRKQMMNFRLEHSILSYRQSTEIVWDMRPSEHTKVDQFTANIMLADMLYRKASETTDPAEEQQLIEEADGLYKRVINSDFIDNGQKDELKLIAVLREAHKKYSPDKPFLMEHGTPREDLRDAKADIKMYVGVQSFLIQLKTLTANEYVEEFNEKILERARHSVAQGTLIVKISTPTLREAYADPGRVHLKKVVDEFATGVDYAGGDFNLIYLIPATENKPKEKKKINRRSVENDVKQYTTLRSLRQFGFDVLPTAEGLKNAREQLQEALISAMEQGELHVSKEMLLNPPDDVVAIMKQYLLDRAA
ncbi:MAG: hypothetical protein UT32_C0007G0020 [Parcubacteria group bacterium GW2011_GWC2_39_14]|nr:MAG: hypothetical protein UT32_C0007G0020 [Parcubacteria group bacterium GW2011_GWC2_39_14]KKR55023.1 MAG: hypothetical protein UT91_C0005G0024 [Parcubacteria group bacterium GW2011_GWA2_40_23]